MGTFSPATDWIGCEQAVTRVNSTESHGVTLVSPNGFLFYVQALEFLLVHLSSSDSYTDKLAGGGSPQAGWVFDERVGRKW
jgi:hypothetical protein